VAQRPGTRPDPVPPSAQGKSAQGKQGKAAQGESAQDKTAQGKSAQDKSAQRKSARGKSAQEKSVQEKSAQGKRLPAPPPARRQPQDLSGRLTPGQAAPEPSQGDPSHGPSAQNKSTQNKAAQNKPAQSKSAQVPAAPRKAMRVKERPEPERQSAAGAEAPPARKRPRMPAKSASVPVTRPGQAGPRQPGGLGFWLRQRRTRSHLSHLPKWTARRPEPFGIGGLHWLPASTGARDAALVLLGGPAATVVAVAEISPGVLRGPGARDLGARLMSVFERAEAAAIPLSRIQVVNQVPGPVGRTRAFVVVSLRYTQQLVLEAARFAQGERGLTLVAAQKIGDVLSMLAADSTAGARLGPLVPLDRPALSSVLGALVLPGRGALWPAAATTAPDDGTALWQPTEVDARSPRFVAMTGPSGPAKRDSTWWHATAWVKKWPRAVGGLDIAACAGFLPPGVSGAAAIVMGVTGPPGDRSPAVAGYVTVSGHDAAEVELARAAARTAAEARDGYVEFCDRRHHLMFSHTLPLATGLRG
jgi:hypothetical protein